MDNYSLFKSLHLVGIILFLGNIIVTGWWKTMADRTGEPRIIAFAQRQVTLTDFIFTAGGIALLLAGGFGLVLSQGVPMQARWMQWSLALFTLSGLLWGLVLVPLQVRLARLAQTFADGGPVLPAYWRLQRLWMVAGIIATLVPLAIVPLMVTKPL